jgi:hypothetical protein
MTQHRRRSALLFSALMLIQVLAPVTFIGSAETPGHSVDTTVDLDLLSTVDLHPSGDLAHGWFDPSEGAGTINLIYRDASVIPVQEWAQWSGMGREARRMVCDHPHLPSAVALVR